MRYAVPSVILAFLVSVIAFAQTANGQCEVRIYNIDDYGSAEVNLEKVLTVKYKKDKKLDISDYLVQGTNTVRFTCENSKIGGYTYSFEVIRDGEVIWSKSCGKAGTKGCNNEDRTEGIVCDTTVTIDGNCNFMRERQDVTCPTDPKD